MVQVMEIQLRRLGSLHAKEVESSLKVELELELVYYFQASSSTIFTDHAEKNSENAHMFPNRCEST